MRIRDWESAAATARSRAAILRAGVDLTWEGPGAGRFRQVAEARWAGLLDLARRCDAVAEGLRALRGMRDAA